MSVPGSGRPPWTMPGSPISPSGSRAWGSTSSNCPSNGSTTGTRAAASDVLGGLGLAATTCAVMSSDRDLTTTDRATTRATQDYLEACIDRSAAVGSAVVAGPMYSPVGRTWREDATERRGTIGRLVEALRPLADRAGERGVRLAIEPLNRFETEPDQHRRPGPGGRRRGRFRRLGALSRHVPHEHRGAGSGRRRRPGAGTDRPRPGLWHGSRRSRCGTASNGHASSRALRGGGYAGPVCIESFTPHNDAIARAAAIWRRSPNRRTGSPSMASPSSASPARGVCRSGPGRAGQARRDAATDPRRRPAVPRGLVNTSSWPGCTCWPLPRRRPRPGRSGRGARVT